MTAPPPPPPSSPRCRSQAISPSTSTPHTPAQNPPQAKTVTITGFLTGTNNVTGVIVEASGGAAGSFSLKAVSQSAETHAGASVGTAFTAAWTPTPTDAHSHIFLDAAVPQNPGRIFVGSQWKALAYTAAAATSPLDISAALIKLFGTIRSGTVYNIRGCIVNDQNGAASGYLTTSTTA